MTFNYHSDTDTLYIDLADRTSTESIEVTPGVVDEQGQLVGIDDDHVRRVGDQSRLEGNHLPVESVALARTSPSSSGKVAAQNALSS